MKKLFMLVILLGLFGCDKGSMLNPDTRTVEPDEVRRLEAPGFDLRVYEFTPETSPHMQCVFVAGDSKGGLNCFPKVKGEL